MHEYDLKKHIAAIAVLANDWSEVKQRVIASYGEELLPLAKEVAIEERGSDFYYSQEYETYRKTLIDQKQVMAETEPRKQTIDEMLFDLEVTKFVENKLSVGANWSEVSQSVIKRFGSSAIQVAQHIFAMRSPKEDLVENNRDEAKHITLTLSEETSERLFQYLDKQSDVEQVSHATLVLSEGINRQLSQYLEMRENKSMLDVQKKTLLATALFLMLSVLFPPYQITVQGMTVSQGFHWIWDKGAYQYTGVVDVPLLLCEILVICIIGAIGYKVLPEIKAD